MLFTRNYKLHINQFASFIKNMLLKLARDNSTAGQLIYQAASNNIFFWLEFFVKLPIFDKNKPLFDTILSGKDFESIYFQRVFIKEIISRIESQKSLIIEKSMSMGASTLLVLIVLWYLLFKPQSRFLFISPAVFTKKYRNNLQWLLQTIKFVLGTLPGCFGHFENITISENKKNAFYFTVSNACNGSIIYVTSSNNPLDLSVFFEGADEAVYKAVIYDEFAFQKNCDLFWDQIKALGIPQIAVSCSNGTSNLFYELVNDPEYDKYTLHWIYNPLCNTIWYNEYCNTKPPEWVEQYLNINYAYKYTEPQTIADKPQQNDLQHPKITKKPFKVGLRKPHKNPSKLQAPSTYEQVIATVATSQYRCFVPDQNDLKDVKDSYAVKIATSKKQNITNYFYRDLYSIDDAVKVINAHTNYIIDLVTPARLTNRTLYTFSLARQNIKIPFLYDLFKEVDEILNVDTSNKTSDNVIPLINVFPSQDLKSSLEIRLLQQDSA